MSVAWSPRDPTHDPDAAALGVMDRVEPLRVVVLQSLGSGATRLEVGAQHAGQHHINHSPRVQRMV